MIFNLTLHLILLYFIVYLYITREKKSNNNKINTDQGGIGVTIVVKKNKYFFNY